MGSHPTLVQSQQAKRSVHEEKALGSEKLFLNSMSAALSSGLQSFVAERGITWHSMKRIRSIVMLS